MPKLRAAQPRHWYDEYLSTEHWQSVRRRALERAAHRCQTCNSPENLAVHHRTYARIGNEDEADLTVLCRTCHGLFHRDGPPLVRPAFDYYFDATGRLLWWSESFEEKEWGSYVNGQYVFEKMHTQRYVTFGIDLRGMTGSGPPPDWLEENYPDLPTLYHTINAPEHSPGQPWGGSNYRSLIEAFFGRKLHRGERIKLDRLRGKECRLTLRAFRSGYPISVRPCRS